MSKDINSFEYFKEMCDCWTREELLQRCYDLCKEIVDKNQEIERLKEEYVLLQNASGQYEDDLDKKIDIMQRYLQMIIDLGFDYDGCNTIEGLKMLISELVRYARMGKNCDIKETVYINGDKTYNILGEEIEYVQDNDKNEI